MINRGWTSVDLVDLKVTFVFLGLFSKVTLPYIFFCTYDIVHACSTVLKCQYVSNMKIFAFIECLWIVYRKTQLMIYNTIIRQRCARDHFVRVNCDHHIPGVIPAIVIGLGVSRFCISCSIPIIWPQHDDNPFIVCQFWDQSVYIQLTKELDTDLTVTAFDVLLISWRFSLFFILLTIASLYCDRIKIVALRFFMGTKFTTI